MVKLVSNPKLTLSMANDKSSISTNCFLFLVDIKAASLTIFSISAGDLNFVPEANFLTFMSSPDFILPK